MELSILKKHATAVRAAFESSAKLQRDGAEKTRVALAAAFPDQAALQSAGHDAYTLIRESAQEGWLKGGGTDGSFRVTWVRALAACKLQAIGKDGTPTTKGKGGGAKKTTEAPTTGAKSKISDEEACTHFFGHADKELINCLLVVSQHEVSFIAWAKSLVLAPKDEGELKKAA